MSYKTQLTGTLQVIPGLSEEQVNNWWDNLEDSPINFEEWSEHQPEKYLRKVAGWVPFTVTSEGKELVSKSEPISGGYGDAYDWITLLVNIFETWGQTLKGKIMWEGSGLQDRGVISVDGKEINVKTKNWTYGN